MSLQIINKKEHIQKIANKLEEARNLLIQICNETYFPSNEYDNLLFLKESLDRLIVHNEKIIQKSNQN
jgi:hypothetical protein